MKHSRSLIAATVSALVGAAIWMLAVVVIHRREPWDAGLYWALFYPLTIAAAAVLGYSFPQRPGLIALIVFEAQFFAMGASNGELGNLWPLGMLLFALLALPGIALAKLASRASPYRPVHE